MRVGCVSNVNYNKGMQKCNIAERKSKLEQRQDYSNVNLLDKKEYNNIQQTSFRGKRLKKAVVITFGIAACFAGNLAGPAIVATGLAMKDDDEN